MVYASLALFTALSAWACMYGSEQSNSTLNRGVDRAFALGYCVLFGMCVSKLLP